MMSFFSTTLASDPEVAAAISDELGRQQDQIEMIASENIVSVAVMEARSSILTNTCQRKLFGAPLLWWLRVC